MTQEQLIQFLKDHLKVEVSTKDKPYRTEITVRLLLDSEEISSDTVNFYKE